MLTPARMLALITLLAVADCAAPFANPDEVLSFTLRLSHADWDVLRSAPMQGAGCSADYPYVQADFRCGDGDDWQTIGVRQKRGEQRGVDAAEKPSLKFDINHVVDNQRWPKEAKDLGFRKLSLNNGQASAPGGVLPALLGEHVGWRILREVMPQASRSAYAQLNVVFTDDGSTSYHGVYVVVEDLDRTQIRARLGAACGALLKATDSDCGEDVDYDDGPPNRARDAYTSWLAAPPSGVASTEAAIDLLSLLRQEAARVIIGGQQDTPTGALANNYFRFEPRGGRVSFFPWDLDNTFGAYPRPISTSETISEPCSDIGDRTRCEHDIRPQYWAQVCDLIQGPVSATRLLATWQHVDQVVRPLLEAERGVVWGGRDPLDASTPGTYASEYNRVSAWIPTHIASVRAELAGADFFCPMSCEEGTARACQVSSCGGAQTCSGGIWTVCQVQPQAEVCNGVDDNCDGIIDEGCKLDKEVCPTATPIPRAPTRHGCNSGSGEWSTFAIMLAIAWRRCGAR